MILTLHIQWSDAFVRDVGKLNQPVLGRTEEGRAGKCAGRDT